MTKNKKRIDMLQELDYVQQHRDETIDFPKEDDFPSVVSTDTTKDDGDQWQSFKDYMVNYTGIKEQGSAVWIPTDVRKRLDKIRSSSKRSIPVRTLLAAITMAFLDEHEQELKNL